MTGQYVGLVTLKSMLRHLYAQWMFAWETRLTTRDTNRQVRPLEWGLDWLADWIATLPDAQRLPIVECMATGEPAQMEAALLAINASIAADSDRFYRYATPVDFRLEERHPQLFPTNVRPETLREDARLQRLAREGRLAKAQFLRFTSPVRTRYAENDQVNARWYPAPVDQRRGRPRQAMIVLPQWNADAFSHNALCSIFNRFGVSALRLSKPFHDIRRPAELERSDYAVSSNLGRTIAACRQAVVDIRCCIDWLEQQGYEQFGILGTSLGSCYAFIASAHDPRLRVHVFNHAATWFGDVVWTGQSTRHIRTAFVEAGLTQDRLRALWAAISPMACMDRFAGTAPARQGTHWPHKQARMIYAPYDLTFLPEFSREVIEQFTRHGVDFEAKVLPCGHYTTGEFPFQYLDGWYMGAYVYRAMRDLRRELGRPVEEFASK
jgi:hypothetical protein